MWKQKLGSGATYQKLIDIFKNAGYHAYAEVVRNIVIHDVEGEIDDFIEPVPQPETYPILKPSPPSSPKQSMRKLSLCEEFLPVNQAAVQDLPEGENITSE